MEALPPPGSAQGDGTPAQGAAERRLLARIGAGVSAALDWAASSWPRRLLLITLVALTTLLPGTWSLPVSDRDEARFAQASRQMVETGDWIDIRFQEEPRWKKPVGIYWLQAASASALGPDEIWPYRLPSLLGALLAAVLTAWAARPLIGPAAATLAGAMTAGILVLAVEATIAKTDAVLLASAVAVMGALARLLLYTDTPRRRDQIIFWAGLGVSILVKGPIVPLVAGLAIAWVGFARKEWPSFARFDPVLGLPLLAAIVLPWLIAIGIISEGQFFAASVGDDMLSKVAAGQKAHDFPPGYYIIAVFGTFWPWAAFLPLVLPWAWRVRHTTSIRFLAGWVLPFWAILELVPTKLPHYVLPLYPALAMLIAAWAVGPAREALWKAWQRRASALLFLLPAAGGALAAVSLPLMLEGRLVWGALILALLAVPAIIIATRAALAGHPLAQIGASLATAACLYPALLIFTLPSMQTAFISPRLVAAAEPFAACASAPLASTGYHEPSLVFLYGTDLAFPSHTEAANALISEPGFMVWVEEPLRPHLDEALAGATVVERAEVTGFNYNRGDMTRIVLLTADDPRWAPCTP